MCIHRHVYRDPRPSISTSTHDWLTDCLTFDLAYREFMSIDTLFIIIYCFPYIHACMYTY